MFCKNCGKELENTAKFCNNCGAPQEVIADAQSVSDNVETQQPVPESYVPQGIPQGNTQETSIPFNSGAPQPPVQTKKSSKGCIIAIIIAVALFVLGVIGVVAIAIFGYNITKDVISNPEFTTSEELDISDYVDEAVTDLTYEEIFSSHNIIDSPAFFMTKESCAFAYADTDGYVEKSEYGYEDDVIIEMVDTYYYPIGEYDEEQAKSYMDFVKAEFKADEELSCCTVTYNTTSSYFIVTEKYTNVDKAETLEELEQAGLITSDYEVDYLSMEQTEQDYLDRGFVKK